MRHHDRHTLEAAHRASVEYLGLIAPNGDQTVGIGFGVIGGERQLADVNPDLERPVVAAGSCCARV
jgi:hypothetical protein